ncbi:MAG: tetratricopeptide repeat protein [Acidobacteriota bacterium]
MKDIKTFRIVFLYIFLLLCCNFISANPSDKSDEQYNKVAVLIDDNQYEQAIQLGKEILKNGQKLGDFKKSRLYNNIGYCYYKLEKFEEAYNFYLKALAIDSTYFLCLNNISAVLIKQKRYEEALPYLNKAHALEGRYVKVIFNLFVTYINLKNVEMAKHYLKKALKIDKDYTLKRLKRNGATDKQIMEIQKFLKDN